MVHEAKGAGEFGRAFVRTGEAVAEISLGVDGDEVCHAVVVGVPEVLETSRGTARHSEAVAVAGEVGLAHWCPGGQCTFGGISERAHTWADGLSVSDTDGFILCSSVVTVGLVAVLMGSSASLCQIEDETTLRTCQAKPCTACSW